MFGRELIAVRSRPEIEVKFKSESRLVSSVAFFFGNNDCFRACLLLLFAQYIIFSPRLSSFYSTHATIPLVRLAPTQQLKKAKVKALRITLRTAADQPRTRLTNLLGSIIH
jgi:hypothetical protein